MPTPAPLPAPYGTGPRAVFLHANGFTPRAYRPLLQTLGAGLSLSAPRLRPLWPDAGPPDRRITWRTLADDLINALTATDSTTPPTPIIAVGHSMGATASILAAAQRPELFRALVLIEPAQVGPPLSWLFRFMPYALRLRSGPAAPTLSRRDHWPDSKAFVSDARTNPVYACMSDEALEHLAAGLLVPTPHGVTLAFTKAWEAHFYTNPIDPLGALRDVTCPVVGIRGGPSMFLSDSRWAALVATQPRGSFHSFPEYGHLLPLEAPDLTAAAVLQGLREVGQR